MNLLTILNIILTIGTIAGGIIAFRASRARTMSEVQERVIIALNTERAILTEQLKNLTERLDELERENLQLRHTISALIKALRKRNIVISLSGDIIRIQDDRGETTERIHESQGRE